MNEFDSIFDIVGNKFGMSREEIILKKRDWEHVRSRVYFILIARGVGYSYKRISRVLQRDHTTIIHLDRSYSGSIDVREYIVELNDIYGG